MKDKIKICIPEWVSIPLLLIFQIGFAACCLCQSTDSIYYMNKYSEAEGYYYKQAYVEPVAGYLIMTVVILMGIEIALFFLFRWMELPATQIIVPLFILLTISITLQSYIAQPSIYKKHFAVILIGILAMLISMVLAKFSCKVQIGKKSFRYILLIPVTLCIFNLLYAIGHTVNGSGGNVNLSVFGFTPGEFLKLFIVFFIGISYLSLKLDLKLRLEFLGVIVFSILTLVLVNDTGNAVILVALLMVVIYILYGFRITVLLIGSGGVAAITGYFLLDLLSHHLSFVARYFDHIRERFQSVGIVLTGTEVRADHKQALMGILRGGIFGNGLKYRSYSTLSYASWNDYAFSSIVSVWGIGIAFLVIGCLAMLIYNCSIEMKDTGRDVGLFGLSNALMTVVAVQSAIHIGGVCNIIPLTGICLGFMSSGGTNLLCNFLCIGLALGGRINDKVVWKLKCFLKKVLPQNTRICKGAN